VATAAVFTTYVCVLLSPGCQQSGSDCVYHSQKQMWRAMSWLLCAWVFSWCTTTAATAAAAGECPPSCASCRARFSTPPDQLLRADTQVAMSAAQYLKWINSVQG
jgi:hypothetical protein